MLPTYNEAQNIDEVLGPVRAAACPTRTVLIVDDGSPDGTADLAESSAASSATIDVLRRAARVGLGSRVPRGFPLGHRPRVRRADRDGLRPLARSGRAAVADGPRSSRAAPVWSSAAATSRAARSPTGAGTAGALRWGNRYAGFVLGLPVRDATVGLSGLSRRRRSRRLDLDTVRADGYGFQIEMAYMVRRRGRADRRASRSRSAIACGALRRCRARSWSKRCGWSRGGPARPCRSAGRSGDAPADRSSEIWSRGPIRPPRAAVDTSSCEHPYACAPRPAGSPGPASARRRADASGESLEDLARRCGLAYEEEFFASIEAGQASLDEPLVRWLAELYGVQAGLLVPARSRAHHRSDRRPCVGR